MVAIEAMTRVLTLVQGSSGADDVTPKEGRDLVTAVDLAVEDSVRHAGGKLTFLVMGEERGGGPPPDGSPYWLVDPICGTRNFASAVPLYCVNLALVERGAITSFGIGSRACPVPRAWTSVSRRRCSGSTLQRVPSMISTASDRGDEA